MSIEVKASKSITVQCPVPATAEDTAAFLTACCEARHDGLVLVGATAVEQGQRDPYTVGVKLTFRPPPTP